MKPPGRNVRGKFETKVIMQLLKLTEEGEGGGGEGGQEKIFWERSHSTRDDNFGGDRIMNRFGREWLWGYDGMQGGSFTGGDLGEVL